MLVGVPAVSLTFLISRLVFNKRISPHWKAGMWSFWVINLISFFAIGSTQVRHFNRGEQITNTIDLSVINSDTLIIDMEPNPYDDAMIVIGDLHLADTELVSYNVNLRVVKSEGDNFELKQVNASRGRDLQNANKLASEIGYNYSIRENKLSLPEIFTIGKGSKWRAQSVIMTLSVPEGKTIRFENDADDLLRRIDIDRDVERPWLHSGQYWVMEKNGLVNIDWTKKNKKDKELDFKDFSRLQLEGKMKVQISKGDDFKVTVTGKENYLNRIEVVQLEKTLSLITDLQNPSSPIRVYVTMPSLQSLDVRDTDDVKVDGFVESKMQLKNDGSYEIKAFINVDSLFLFQDGRGKIDVRGSGKYLKADLDNNGKIDTERFSVNTAEIRAKEYSKASLAVSDVLIIKRDDLSRISVDGEPEITEEVQKH